MGNFSNSEEKYQHFDSLIDLYKNNDFQGFEIGVSSLKYEDRRSFLIYVFKEKDNLPEMNQEIMMKLILDYL